MKDNLYIRLTFSIILYLFFLILLFRIDFHIDLFLMLIYAVPFILYKIHDDGLPLITKEEIVFLIINISYFFSILLIFIPNKLNEWMTIVIYQALFEELFFRFCMIGITKKYVKFKSPLSVLLVLIINSFLFSCAHVQYQALEQKIIIFMLGVINGIIYLSVGIFPSVISHALWNFYYNIILILPIIITAFISIFFILNKNRALKK